MNNYDRLDNAVKNEVRPFIGRNRVVYVAEGTDLVVIITQSDDGSLSVIRSFNAFGSWRVSVDVSRFVPEQEVA